ncbi:uncharacterized protein PHACADRAFT_251994 [Phanerochaete carnosa HHB-10118-sp]|uniref:C2H2-type domain-containing protein n=1 Tax=Phanerochaete carnosa (strain HHB-10118-sp) TaxID=650164 RepID=K5X598_PHACS|nr:uncharacterized protein PHACADRAFT_251994 [Phanerochaete carnosa HHB-10118-sp]EKM58032.1 hypothetical protein PHACADRAFT_251994 [Phanerochaete carnosa HHB-10118-sp]
MRGALFNASPASRPSPSMPLNAPLFDDQLYHQYQYAATSQRYHQGSYPSAASASILGGATGDSLTSYGSRQSWSTGSQHGSDYDSPNSTPYSEYGPPLEQEYYSNANSTSSTQSVAYPESSQRTHVSNSAYNTMYNSRYYSPSTGSAMSSRTSRSPEEELASYSFTESSHNPSPVLGAESALRGGRSSWQDFSDTSYDHLTSTSYSRSQPSASSQLGGLPGLSGRSRPPTQQDVLSSFVGRRDSATLPSHSSHLRLPGNLGEPGNPAVVPPLVYDGEEYDDESEGSLPSASADVYRSTYQAVQSSRRSSTDEMAGSISGSSGGDNSVEPRSPTPPPDSALSSPHMLPERQGGERSKPTQPKKSKMHQCTVCQKWFPRPSGLATHMNSHSGAKPYKCPIPNCTKSFAVRSNAKRHLRTHGIFPSSDHPTAPSQFTVGFDAPIISEVHEVGKLPSKLRWVPQSLATRTNVEFLRDAQSDSDEEYPPSCPVLSVPLPAVVPSEPKWSSDDFEDRNSYEDMGASPYLDSHQWRALPGPAIVNPPSL